MFPKFFETISQDFEVKFVVIANLMIGDTVVNYLVERYDCDWITAGGIPAAGNGWHVRPFFKRKWDKRPAATYILTEDDLRLLMKRNNMTTIKEL